MYALAALVAYALVTIGMIAIVVGNVVPGAGVFLLGCAVAASTRLGGRRR